MDGVVLQELMRVSVQAYNNYRACLIIHVFFTILKLMHFIADFKIIITSYCGRVRANVIGKLGTLSGGLTDAQIIANEFEVEYEHLASAVGLYPQQLYLSPVITESNEMYIT